MQLSRRGLLQSTLATAVPLARARAQGGAKTIRIGVMNDLSGPYRDGDGPTSVGCARQAVEEFGSQGFRVEVLVGDHQNKPDIGAAIVRQWFDRDGVDAVADVNNSSVALAVNTIA